MACKFIQRRGRWDIKIVSNKHKRNKVQDAGVKISSCARSTDEFKVLMVLFNVNRINELKILHVESKTKKL